MLFEACCAVLKYSLVCWSTARKAYVYSQILTTKVNPELMPEDTADQGFALIVANAEKFGLSTATRRSTTKSCLLSAVDTSSSLAE